jgi:hypothetical protein
MTTYDEITKPSNAGKLRYKDGYYTANGWKTPCTCLDTCPQPCKGKCGCPACREAYGDFLSSQ